MTFEGSNGAVYRLRTIGEGHWIVSSPSKVQVEIRRLVDGSEGFSFLSTDGKNSEEGVMNNWQEIAARF